MPPLSPKPPPDNPYRPPATETDLRDVRPNVEPHSGHRLGAFALLLAALSCLSFGGVGIVASRFSPTSLLFFPLLIAAGVAWLIAAGRLRRGQTVLWLILLPFGVFGLLLLMAAWSIAHDQ